MSKSLDSGRRAAADRRLRRRRKRQIRRWIRVASVGFIVLAAVVLCVALFGSRGNSKEQSKDSEANQEQDKTAVDSGKRQKLDLPKGDYEGIYDLANILDAKEEAAISEFLRRGVYDYGMEIAVVTARDMQGMNTREYADAIRNQLMPGGFGYVVLLDMEGKTIYVSRTDKVIEESDLDMVLGEALANLDEGEYVAGITNIVYQIQFCHGEMMGLATNAGDQEEVSPEKEEDSIHTYELIVADVTWTEAYYDCIMRGGYLARINSEKEFQVIREQIASEGKRDIKFWLGGTR